MNPTPSEFSAESRRGPLLDLLEMRPETVRPGHVVVLYQVGASHLRTGGIAHGGVIATLMDTTLGLSASSLCPEGFDVVTAQININFIRPAWPGEHLRAEGTVRHAGRKTAVATGEILSEQGALVATGSATFVYVPATDFRREGSESAIASEGN